jgi:beta-glucosidase
VVKLYIRDGYSKIDRPAQELKGFELVELQPGETKKVGFVVDRAALSYWSLEKEDIGRRAG